MKEVISHLRADQSGGVATEYGMIAALIAVTMVIGASDLGDSINTAFLKIRDRITQATAK